MAIRGQRGAEKTVTIVVTLIIILVFIMIYLVAIKPIIDKAREQGNRPDNVDVGNLCGCDLNCINRNTGEPCGAGARCGPAASQDCIGDCEMDIQTRAVSCRAR